LCGFGIRFLTVKQLFKIFDRDMKGSISKEDLLHFLKFHKDFDTNQEAIIKTLDKCFATLKDLYGNVEITPIEFYKILDESNSKT
jgi:Ca2+-binding EF-hand superfamily protein